ncbi:methyltransferase domain-containing protein [Luminiphilus sp.]|nr:methyltransferase domain-containing protein [Luminiphilus sp.]
MRAVPETIINSNLRWVPAWALYTLGLLALIFIWIRGKFQSYSRPRVFNVNDIERSISYDLEVLQRYKRYLDLYSNSDTFFDGASVLELGPGADLGIGLALKQEKVESYTAFDVNPLAFSSPFKLYSDLGASLNYKEGMVTKFYNDLFGEGKVDLEGSTFEYIVDSEFRFESLGDRRFDVVLSNAAFEHFDNVTAVVSDCFRILKGGGVFLADVDLQTHTRWLRDNDPLNIYRYSTLLWTALSVPGSPNRVLVEQYKTILTEAGFVDIEVFPRIVLDEKSVQSVNGYLSKEFRDSDLRIIDFIIAARKATCS